MRTRLVRALFTQRDTLKYRPDTSCLARKEGRHTSFDFLMLFWIYFSVSLLYMYTRISLSLSLFLQYSNKDKKQILLSIVYHRTTILIYILNLNIDTVNKNIGKDF